MLSRLFLNPSHSVHDGSYTHSLLRSFASHMLPGASQPNGVTTGLLHAPLYTRNNTQKAHTNTKRTSLVALVCRHTRTKPPKEGSRRCQDAPWTSRSLAEPYPPEPRGRCSCHFAFPGRVALPCCFCHILAEAERYRKKKKTAALSHIASPPRSNQLPQRACQTSLTANMRQIRPETCQTTTGMTCIVVLAYHLVKERRKRGAASAKGLLAWTTFCLNHRTPDYQKN